MATAGEPEILAACLAGDRDAFRALFDIHSGRIRSIALHFCSGDGSAADDIVQGVFLRLHAKLAGFRQDSRLSTWLHRLTVNACLDHRRGRGRLVALEAAEAHASSPAVRGEADAAERAQRERRVREAVAGLPPKLRIAVLLRHFEDLSYDDMASALGCSAGTVASRLNRGHAALARALSEFAPQGSVQ